MRKGRVKGGKVIGISRDSIVSRGIQRTVKSSNAGRIAWAGERIPPTKHTKLAEIPGTVTINGGRYRVGASVHVEFDEKLETKA